MSAKHPVIAVTGSSGAGTTTTSVAFRKIFQQLNIRAAELEGDSFHRYTRPEMDAAIRKARDLGRHISYFGPEANDFGLLQQSFIDYGKNGTGRSRKYLHTYDEAVPYNQVPGTFTPWEPLPAPTDVLFYEGCTAAWSPITMTWPNTSICWSAWCRSSTRVDSETDPRHRRARPLSRSSDGFGGAFDGRLHQLHHAAVLAHPHQLPARADGGHLQPVRRQGDSLTGRKLRGDPLPRAGSN